MKPVLYAMPGNKTLADRLAGVIGAVIGKAEFRRFPDGDTYVRVASNSASIKDRSVVITCTLDRPDEKILTLWFFAETLRELGAKSIGLVCPYLPYMRQDKRFRKGEAITSNIFARMMSAHFDWMVTVDPHLHRHKNLSEIYSIPTEVVHAAPLISAWIRDQIRKPIVIGPDEESEQWVASVAADAGAPYLVLKKVRSGDRSVKVRMPDFTKIRGRNPVIVDDIISTARTMIETVQGLKKLGSANPRCVGVHGIFAGAAHRELKAAGATVIATCNTVIHPTNKIDVSELLGSAIKQFLHGTG